MANRIGTLRPEDRAAVYQTAKRLKIDPYELGAVIHKESSFNPNIWGGAGGKYYGLIQFGTPERTEAGLDPKRIGSYTIREQLPNVERWLAGRGYRPGMGVEKLYATILGGNPNANIYKKDAFGTSVANAISSFRPGGALYKRAQGTLGDAPDGTILESYSAAQPGTTGSSPSQTSRQQIDAAVGRAILNSIVRSFAGNDQLVGDYGPSTQPSTPFSNEADVEGVESDADYSELAEMIKSSVATNKEEDRAMRQQLMSSQMQSQTSAQKANMAALMRQAMEAFKTPTPVF